MKQRNPMILVPVFATLAAVAYVALVKPGLEGLKRSQRAATDLRAEVKSRSLDVQGKAAVERRLKEVEAEIARFEAQQIEPLLESYAMRAKSIVGGFATDAGLVDVEFTERPALALPVVPGKAVPANLHARQPVMVSCRGDYAAIVSFVLRVESELPHVAVGGLRILASRDRPDLQRAEILLEWPVKGAAKK